MIEFAKLIRSTLGTRVRTILAQVAMFGAEGEDENSEQSENSEVLHPVGFVSRPTSGSATAEAVIVRDGDEVHVLFFLDKTDTVHDCEEGEAQTYSPKEPTCRIRLRADGSLEITAKSGQDIVLNGGTKSVGRVDDEVQVTIPVGTFLTAASAGVLNAAPVTVTGKINAGATHVKA